MDTAPVCPLSVLVQLACFIWIKNKYDKNIDYLFSAFKQDTFFLNYHGKNNSIWNRFYHKKVNVFNVIQNNSR